MFVYFRLNRWFYYFITFLILSGYVTVLFSLILYDIIKSIKTNTREKNDKKIDRDQKGHAGVAVDITYTHRRWGLRPGLCTKLGNLPKLILYACLCRSFTLTDANWRTVYAIIAYCTSLPTALRFCSDYSWIPECWKVNQCRGKNGTMEICKSCETAEKCNTRRVS